MNNPYTSRGPVQDARMFYGRCFELSEISAFLRGNQSVSIVGPHEIGKTSLLLHLMRAETKTLLGIGNEVLFIYVDCRELISNPQNEVLVHLCSEIAKALQYSGQAAEPSLVAAIANPTWFAIEVALHKLDLKGNKVVLLLDDFEQLTMNPQLEISFYNALRSLAGRLPIVYLTCSSKPLVELTYVKNTRKVLSSPLFNIFAHVTLGLLSEAEARDLIRMPMEAAGKKVNAQLVDFVYHLVGGHPLALQIACFHAWQNYDDLLEIELSTKQELEDHFQHYWRELSQAEKDVLQRLIETGLPEVNDPAVVVILHDLNRKCLLSAITGSDKFPSKAWFEFVASRKNNPML